MDEKKLTDLELQIMQVIWSSDPVPVSVEEIQEVLREDDDKELALASVRTMLGILQGKDYVAREKEGRRYYYRATVDKRTGLGGLLKRTIDKAFSGSALDLVASLFQGGMLEGRDAEKMKAMMREYERREKAEGGEEGRGD